MRHYNLSLLFFLLFFASCVSAQKWSVLEALPYDGDRRIKPHTAILLEIRGEQLREQLFAAPHEHEGPIGLNDQPLQLPMPDGEVASFDIVGYDIMPEADLARYPNIRTWYGRNRDKPTQTIYLDWTERGFHASIIGDGVAVHLEPLFRGSTDLYQIFRVTDFDLSTIEPFECGTADHKFLLKTPLSTSKLVGDCALVQYRTAISTDHDYSNYHGASSAAQSNLVQSAVVTALNRANQIMTQALSLRQQLVVNNAILYNYTAAGDPFNGISIREAIDVNQGYTDGRIGSGAYDHGHVFVGASSQGGVAYLNSGCRGSKAGAASSRSIPEGFFFDTRILTHEMGHSFGAPHTYSNVCNNQQGIPVEPGSGSTLMSYAGVCTPNVVGVVEPYFHGRSIDQMTTYLELGGGDCGAVIDQSLSNPTIQASPDFTAPAGTPLRLSASATGNETLLYNWEQYENVAVPDLPQPDQTEGSIFRSFTPSGNPVRYLPQLPEVFAGNNPVWEVIPTVSRRLNFRATIIHENDSYGCASADNIIVDLIANPNPFRVTYPNGPGQWAAGQTGAVIWDVAGTSTVPFNASVVDILFTNDGGNTLTPLLTNTANDGYAEVTVPALTSNARLMIVATDNVFFNVSEANIRIGTTVDAPSISIGADNTSATSSCTAVDNISYDITTAATGAATAPISWSISGLPNGVSASYSENPTRPTVPLRISLDGAASVTTNGTYNLTLTGSSADGNLSQALQLVVDREEVTDAFLITGPIGQSSSLRPRLRALPVDGVMYEYELRDNTTGALLFASTSEATEQTVPNFLEPATTYRYRLRANNGCSVGEWSEQLFTTPANCIDITTSDSPRTILTDPIFQEVTQEITFAEGGATVMEMNVREIDLTHTFLGDLEIDLTSPEGRTIRLFNRSCRGDEDMLAGYVDRGADALSCPPVSGQLLQPVNGTLAGYADEELSGNWRLTVRDLAGLDGGQLNNFTLQVCYNGVLLPVEWLSFTLSPQKDHLQLDWATASEIDNAGFYVERTTQGQLDWTELGFVAAETVTDYRYADHTALPYTDYFYRLRQTDLDGSISYSDIRTGRYGDEAALGLLLFPNPTNGQLNYRTAQPAPYRLLDITGRTLRSGQLETAGLLDLTDLPEGVYLLRTATLTRRLIKSR